LADTVLDEAGEYADPAETTAANVAWERARIKVLDPLTSLGPSIRGRATQLFRRRLSTSRTTLDRSGIDRPNPTAERFFEFFTAGGRNRGLGGLGAGPAAN
jgi:hypothetical protein